MDLRNFMWFSYPRMTFYGVGVYKVATVKESFYSERDMAINQPDDCLSVMSSESN